MFFLLVGVQVSSMRKRGGRVGMYESYKYWGKSNSRCEESRWCSSSGLGLPRAMSSSDLSEMFGHLDVYIRKSRAEINFCLCCRVDVHTANVDNSEAINDVHNIRK